MKNLLQTVVVLCFCCAFLSCQTQTKQEKLISEVREMVEYAEQQHNELTLEEWKSKLSEIEKKFKDLDIKSIKKEDFTFQQKLELAAYSARFTAISMGGASTNESFVKKAGTGKLDSLEEIIKERSKVIDATIDKETNEIANDDTM